MGPLLALATWGVALGGVLVLGAPWTWVTGVGGARRVSADSLRHSLWVGLAVLFLAILITNLLVPLRSGAAAAILLAVLVLSLLAAVVMRPRLTVRFGRPNPPAVVVSVLSALAVVYFSLVAMGPVTNYDSGLYHIGAIRYAGDFATIPGLANLYQAFGYNNSQFPFAAAFTMGPWGTEGMRLANGFLIMVLLADLTLRWWSRRRGRGAWVMLVASVCLLIPMIALADYWVTSPTSDSAVYVLCVVAGVYLVDALTTSGSGRRGAAAVVIVTSALVLSMRPTMGPYVAGLVIVALVLIVRRGGRAKAARSPIVLVCIGLSAAILGTQVVRDRILSGWLMYPLSVLPFDVPWRALDPVNTRLSTLGAARDPGNYLAATEGWQWVGPWVGRLVDQWEVFAWLVLLAFVMVLLVIRRSQGVRGLWSAHVGLAIAPSLVAVVAWWTVSPPAFRFIWGPMFMLLVIPAGWLLAGISARAGAGHGPADRGSITTRIRGFRADTISTMLALFAVGAVTFYTLAFRVDWPAWSSQDAFAAGPIRLAYSFAPIQAAPVEEVRMPSGLVLGRPTESDQCWMTYPLCTPLIEAEVVPRGNPEQFPAEISEGFTYRG